MNMSAPDPRYASDARSLNPSMQKSRQSEMGGEKAISEAGAATANYQEVQAPKFNNKIYMNSKIDNVIDKEFIPI